VLRTFAPRGAARVRRRPWSWAKRRKRPASRGEDDGGGAFDAAEADDLAGALLLGRTEYTVRSLDAVTGAERWNVTFAELEPLGAAARACSRSTAPAMARCYRCRPAAHAWCWVQTKRCAAWGLTVRACNGAGSRRLGMLTRGTPQAGSGGRCSWRPQR
jgi:hypothetical protein